MYILFRCFCSICFLIFLFLYLFYQISDVDVLCAGMDMSLSTVGGFCVGSHQVVDHQRLSGAGYCFSASSPPYTSTAGSLLSSTLKE